MAKKRERALTQMLLDAGYKLLAADALQPRWASTARLPPIAETELYNLLSRMGGRKLNSRPHITAGGWDIPLEGGLIIELDEDAHFNRYRAQTLDMPWAGEVPWTDDYLRYCQAFEDDCLRAANWGKYWKNKSTEEMFGPSDPPGILGELGSSRWKQRALYETLRDALVLHTPGLSLARISVYDTIGEQSVNQVLSGGRAFVPQALREFIEARTLVGTNR